VYQKKQRELEERMAAFDHVAHGFKSYKDAFSSYCRECEYAPYEVTDSFEQWCACRRQEVVNQKAFWEQKDREAKEQQRQKEIEEYEEGVRQRGLEMVKWEQERMSVRGVKARKTRRGVMRLLKKIALVFVL
jgi:hypothetical protein